MEQEEPKTTTLSKSAKRRNKKKQKELESKSPLTRSLLTDEKVLKPQESSIEKLSNFLLGKGWGKSDSKGNGNGNSGEEGNAKKSNNNANKLLPASKIVECHGSLR